METQDLYAAKEKGLISTRTWLNPSPHPLREETDTLRTALASSVGVGVVWFLKTVASAFASPTSAVPSGINDFTTLGLSFSQSGHSHLSLAGYVSVGRDNKCQTPDYRLRKGPECVCLVSLL